MPKMMRILNGSLDQALARVTRATSRMGMSVQLVDDCRCQFGDATVVMRVYEKYFMRNNSAASLSVTVAGRDGEPVTVMAIGSGGGTGVFNFSFGANSNLVEQFESFL